MPWQMRAIVRAWEFNVTPQMVLRALGSFGPRVARGLVSGRFGNSVGDKAMAELVSDYLYHVCNIHPRAEPCDLTVPLSHTYTCDCIIDTGDCITGQW